MYILEKKFIKNNVPSTELVPREYCGSVCCVAVGHLHLILEEPTSLFSSDTVSPGKIN